MQNGIKASFYVHQDLAAIEMVWELTNQWDEAWESYKCNSFWLIKADEMENMVIKM